MMDILAYCFLVFMYAIIHYTCVYRKDLVEVGLMSLVGVVAAFVLYYGTMFLQATSHEIRSGSVLSKNVYYDPYTETYSCGDNTCTRQVPRWRWDVEADIGTYSEYSSSKMFVPDIYEAAKLGEPYAETFMFMNYQYLSNNTVMMDKQHRYDGWLPSYPSVYSGYKVNRGISNILSPATLSQKLSEAHKVWGPTYQVNVIVCVVGSNSAGFTYALRNAWVGGKKNDVVLVLYVEGKNVVNAEAFSRSTQTKRTTEYADFETTLIENAKRIGEYDEDKIIEVLDDALPYFEREDLSKYSFLQAEYAAPLWLNAVHLALIGLLMFGSVQQYRKNRPYRY